MTHPLPFLPYGRQSIDEADIAAVTAVLRGDWLTQGPTVERLERALAAHTGAAEAVVCATGTAALHLAYLALGLEPDDAVVVPAITFLATASAAVLAGGRVVFADVDPATGLMTVDSAAAAARKAADAGWRVRALVPVHLAGQTVDPALSGLAAALGCVVIEDACHAIGSAVVTGHGPNGHAILQQVGACNGSAMACFSFHPVKTIAAGEGGAVTTNDPALAARLRRFRNHGMERSAAMMANPPLDADGALAPWYYEMPEIGLNYRLSDLHCALALSQMGRIDGFIARRRALIERYDQQLAPLAPLVQPIARMPWCRPAWHLNAVRIDFAAAGVDRATMMARLKARGIGSQVHYIPVHQQPYWRNRGVDHHLPGAETYYAHTLSLPLYPAMTDADADRVVDALTAALRGEKTGS